MTALLIDTITDGTWSMAIADLWRNCPKVSYNYDQRGLLTSGETSNIIDIYLTFNVSNITDFGVGEALVGYIHGFASKVEAATTAGGGSNRSLSHEFNTFSYSRNRTYDTGAGPTLRDEGDNQGVIFGELA